MKIEEQQELLEHWYKSIKAIDRAEANNWKKRFDSREDLFTTDEQQKFFKLLTFRYHLMNEDMKRAKQTLESLRPEKEEEHWLNYYYHFFIGIYYFDGKDYVKSIEHFTQAKAFAAKLETEELAEFDYKLAYSYYKNYEITQSIKYAEKSLELFRTKIDFKRISNCENLLGMNNSNIEQYKEAELHFHNALVASEKSEDRLTKFMVLQNYGKLSTKQNKTKTALSLLTRAKKLIHPWENRIKVQNLFLISKNLFRNGEIDIARRKLNFDLIIAEQNEYIDYFHHCNMLMAKYVNTDLFEETYQEGISFFYENKLWVYVIEYSEDLASHYRDHDFHEHSGQYYHLAVLAKNKFKEKRATLS